MLTRLSISNYAIIDNLTIDFHEKLNSVTGETGAGKSIILGALGLILGNRADLSVLKEKSKKCIVEGVFEIGNYHLQPFSKRMIWIMKPLQLFVGKLLHRANSGLL